MQKRYWSLIAALYVLAFPYHPALRSPNELCRLWQTRAIVEYGTLDINRALRDYGPVGDLSFMQGRFYPSKAPLLAFAAVPIYATLRALEGNYPYAVPEIQLVYFSRLLLTVLPTLFLLFLIRRFLGNHVSAPVADAVTLTYALGTLALSYSLLFMSHQTTAVLLFSAFYVIWRISRGEWRYRGYVLAGACIGATIAAEYTGALGVLGLVAYVLAGFHYAEGSRTIRLALVARATGLSALGALPFIVGLGLYHWKCFGSPLETGYRHLADAAYQPWHLGGFLGIRTPDPRAFVLSFFSPLRGLFTLSPFLLLSLPGLFRQGRLAGRGECPLIVLTGFLWIAYAYFTSSFSYDSWGWTTGPRHLTGLVPFLMLPVAVCLEEVRRQKAPLFRALLGLCSGLCMTSIIVTGALTTINYVPDDVVNGFWGLSFPLLRAGYFPPTVLSFFHVPTPWAGLPFILGMLGGMVATARLLLSPTSENGLRKWPERLISLSTPAILLSLLLLAKPSAHDSGAVRFLENAWVAPPGHAVEFWR